MENILLNVFGCSMKHRSFYDTQRVKPTLRLHSSRFVVESCDVFVGKRILFEQFGNIHPLRVGWPPTPQVYFGP